MMKVLCLSMIVLTACGSTSAPDRSGVADVSGRIIDASGATVRLARVAIQCKDAAISLQVGTDTLGGYLTPLTLTAQQMKSFGGSITCNFGAPDSINGKFRAVATVTFFPAGSPHPLQMVDLTEVR
jgi:hypothetical protein